MSFFGKTSSDIISFDGRLSRLEYLFASLRYYFIGPLVVGAAYYFLNVFVAVILAIPFLVFKASIAARRLHDFDSSGWYSILYVLFPFLQIILVYYPGNLVENKYGPSPKIYTPQFRRKYMNETNGENNFPPSR